MVHEAQEQQQQPIMRDFLGLGKLAVADNHADGESTHVEEPYFLSAPGFPTPSVNMDSSGVQYPLFNIRSSIDQNYTLRKPSEEQYQEGSAETFGLTYPRGWQGIVPNSARLEANAKPNSTQLTIFYGGHVNVYNNIPFERAEAIMQMAAKVDSLPTAPLGMPHGLGAPGFFQPATAAENFCFNAQIGAPIHFTADQTSQNGLPAHRQFECVTPNTPSTATSSQPVVPKALPLARKASLARFLEKRKERMQMMSPYFKKQLAPVQGEQMVSSLPNAAFSELYDQYFRRPTMGFCMQEQTDMSSFNIPAKTETR